LQLAEHLELAGFLDKVVESFPTDKEVLSRPVQSLTRPELAVLMSASKMYLTRQIESQSDLLLEECCSCYLQSYFPEQLSMAFSAHLSGHPLAKEIKATVISNKIINQAGSSFLCLESDGENSSILDYISCYLAFDRILEGESLRQAIFALDNVVATGQQYGMLIQLESVLSEFCQWALNHEITIRPNNKTITRYGSYLTSYRSYLIEHKEGEIEQQLEQYRQDGVPDELALSMVVIAGIHDFPLLVTLSIETAVDFTLVLTRFNEVISVLGLDKIYKQLIKLPVQGYWERKLLTETLQDMKHLTGRIVKTVLQSQSVSSADYFKLPAIKQKLNSFQRLYQEINHQLPVNLLPYIVLIKELEKFVEQAEALC
jgi:glutamate dehydrogenase